MSSTSGTTILTLRFEAFVDKHEFGRGPPEPPSVLGKIEKCKPRFLHIQRDSKRRPTGVAWSTDGSPAGAFETEATFSMVQDDNCKHLLRIEASVGVNKVSMTVRRSHNTISNFGFS